MTGAGMTSDEETCPLLSLPTEMIVHILMFLGPEDLMAVERTCRQISRLVRVPQVLRSTKFLPSNSAGAFRDYLDESRSVAISELDLNDFMAAGSRTVERCVHYCVNLTTLRCVNTHLLPTAMIRLLQDSLRCLKFLEWSILGSPSHKEDTGDFSRQNSDTLVQPIFPETLTDMYVEVKSWRDNINFLCFILARGFSLRKLHFHERRLSLAVTTTAYRVLQSFHDGTAGNFEQFTVTSDCATGRPPPGRSRGPGHAPESVLGVLEASLKLSSSVIVRHNPRPITNCVALDRWRAHLVPDCFSTLFIVIEEDAFATLEAAAQYHWHHNTRSLTLQSPSAETHAHTSSAAHTVSLLNFLRGCHSLTELNLVSFHFEANVDCCSVLADAGLVRLRALSLPSCAVRGHGRLARLARARFRLDELDVRTALDARSSTCDVCKAPSICTEQAFQSLHLLCPLRRFTLCDLPHVRHLRFLGGCVVRELRLRNLGRGCFAIEETAALREVMEQLHSLKLESSVVPLKLTFLRRVLTHAPRLRRFCFASTGITPSLGRHLVSTLGRLYPAMEYIHVHTWMTGLHQEHVNIVACPVIRPDGDGEAWYIERVLSSDCLVLCYAHNLVCAPRPRNCGPRRF